MLSGGAKSVALLSILALGGCADFFRAVNTVSAVARDITFAEATSVKDCRAAERAMLGRNALLAEDQRTDPMVIHNEKDRCLDRVYAAVPVSAVQSVHYNEGLPYCPPDASVLYGGAAYCVRR